jgi:glycosyltransferase involved in cell wall biosynthesis
MQSKTAESSSRKIKLVFAAVKGPPFGGMPTVTAIFLTSSIFTVNDTLFVDTTPINRDYGPLQIFRVMHSFRLFARLIKAVIQHHAQVVYIMSPSLMGFYEKGVMALVCKLLGTRTVIHLLGGGFKNFYERSFFNRILIRFLLRRCDAVATVSEYWRSYVAKMVPQNKVWIIPNPVEAKKFLELKEKGFERKKVIFLFAGAITSYKGIRDLLEAVQKARDSMQTAKVRIIGDGDLMDECQKKVKEEQLDDTISFLGYVSEEEKIRLFRTSDVFVLPSHMDAFPVAILEAMSAGMPVVSTMVGGIPSIVHEGETGFLVPPGDINALSQRMIRLIEDPDLREKMGQRAAKYVSENFDVELVARRLNELLESVVHGEASKRNC